MNQQITIGQLVEALPTISSSHSRTNPAYKLFEVIADEVVSKSNLCKTSDAFVDLGKLGKLNFPYQKFGSIDSLDLFGLDELIIFSFYLTNKEKYKNAFDIGANIGVHSIIMNLCGWNITCIEPDPLHMSILKNNLSINNISNINTVEAAVSDVMGEMEFVRVNGNTTSSHLAGSKQPYGDLTRFPVKVLFIKDIMKDADIIKMDVEGNEKNIILATDQQDWTGTDMMLEIGSEGNAVAVFEHLRKIDVNCFSQKTGWALVKELDNVPTSYKEGSLFISRDEKINWG
jgi:FkbM family methyltransferase